MLCERSDLLYFAKRSEMKSALSVEIFNLRNIICTFLKSLCEEASANHLCSRNHYRDTIFVMRNRHATHLY